MPRICVSSTYEDLKDYREAANGTLRKLQQQVICMEDYVATDRRPLKQCLQDVAESDLYVGIFAWRYGFVPKEDNPEKKSITELEFGEAGRRGRPRLIFLADDNHPWPPSRMDAVTGEGRRGASIRALREALRDELMVSPFTTPDNLAMNVSIAVSIAQATQPVTRRLDLPGEITDLHVIRSAGSTLTPAIADKIREAMNVAEGARIAEIDLGTGETWWSTRLFLMAALAQDYTGVSQFLFVGGDGKFIGMASLAAVRAAFAPAEVSLERIYADCKSALGQWKRCEDKVVALSQDFRMRLSALTGGEADVKTWVTQESLTECLGADLHRDWAPLQRDMPAMLASIQQAGLGAAQPFMPLIRDGRPVELIDPSLLARAVPP